MYFLIACHVLPWIFHCRLHVYDQFMSLLLETLRWTLIHVIEIHLLPVAVNAPLPSVTSNIMTFLCQHSMYVGWVKMYKRVKADDLMKHPVVGVVIDNLSIMTCIFYVYCKFFLNHSLFHIQVRDVRLIMDRNWRHSKGVG